MHHMTNFYSSLISSLHCIWQWCILTASEGNFWQYHENNDGYFDVNIHLHGRKCLEKPQKFPREARRSFVVLNSYITLHCNICGNGMFCVHFIRTHTHPLFHPHERNNILLSVLKSKAKPIQTNHKPNTIANK